MLPTTAGSTVAGSRWLTLPWEVLMELSEESVMQGMLMSGPLGEQERTSSSEASVSNRSSWLETLS